MGLGEWEVFSIVLFGRTQMEILSFWSYRSITRNPRWLLRQKQERKVQKHDDRRPIRGNEKGHLQPSFPRVASLEKKIYI